jgi:predicted HicB family RNase H-like nuclease
MPTLKPKPKKPGRPRLAKADAKGTIVPVRFSQEDRKRVEFAAKASKQTVSAWIRSTLATAIEAGVKQ